MNIDKVLSIIEESKKIIATERDKLRDIYDTLEDCLESFDKGIEGLDRGKLEIESAIDAISEVV